MSLERLASAFKKSGRDIEVVVTQDKDCKIIQIHNVEMKADTIKAMCSFFGDYAFKFHYDRQSSYIQIETNYVPKTFSDFLAEEDII